MCSCLFIEMNQTAHISLQIPSISNNVGTQFPEPQRQNLPEAPHLFGATRVIYLKILCLASLLAAARRSVWRPVVRLSAAGEGVSTDITPYPQPLFCSFLNFF
jgi:hypothetical protein